LSNFEFVFSLLVILLGLGLGQVLTGLARVLKRPGLQLGWATGLLAAWTITETITFWRIVWRTRDVLPDTTAALFAGFIVTGLYFFAAASVFPDDIEVRDTLDDYFMAEKAKVIGAVLAAIALAFLLRPAVMGWTSWSVLTWVDWVSLAFIFTLGPTAMLTRRRKVAIACLAFLVAPIDLLLGLVGSLAP
jgi:hypothetical protein